LLPGGGTMLLVAPELYSSLIGLALIVPALIAQMKRSGGL
jgi:hypothetical protein